MTARLNQIAIIVDDMGRSLAFYRQLGLEPPAGSDSEGHVEVSLPGGMRLAWDSAEVIRSFDPDWKAPSGGQRVGLAFLYDTPADVDSAYADLERQGYHGHKAPWDAFWGQRYAQISDPDGNVVDLFAPLKPS
jgi:catechol 2,3-dioxygenase-like lactoylglutathione lyase family enzyme